MRLFLSRLHFPVHTLGPGARIGLWLQGCSIRCPGCISADTWAPERGETTVAAVMATLAPWLPVADGITVSGGEPFDQPEALRALLAHLREVTPGDILVFTGYAREALEEPLRAYAGLIDALITDPFEVASPQTRALRGSDNQRLHCLTPLGEARFRAYERPLAPEDRRLD
ncbi:MAG: 4Fe-4S single cluster domain-containing protein, partial [Archangium sp.]